MFEYFKRFSTTTQKDAYLNTHIQQKSLIITKSLFMPSKMIEQRSIPHIFCNNEYGSVFAANSIELHKICVLKFSVNGKCRFIDDDHTIIHLVLRK